MKLTKRRMTLLLTALLAVVLALGVNADGALPFHDVQTGRWSYQNILWCYETGIIKGKTPTAFCPADKMSRAELVTMLGRFTEAQDGEREVSGYACNQFRDVAAGSYYEEYVAWAYHYGIVKGTSETAFSPAMTVSREQFVTIVYRYLENYIGINADEKAIALKFTDTAKISGYAKTAANAVCGLSIINGKPGNLFDPAGVATREEAAKILNVLNTTIHTYAADDSYVLATSLGIYPNTDEDLSEKIQTAITNTADGKTFVLANGEYRIGESIVAKGKRNVTIDGNGATFRQRNATGAHAFVIQDSSNMKICNMNLGTVVPEFVGGDVTDATVETYTNENDVLCYRFFLYFTVDDGYQCTGEEIIHQLVTQDKNGKTDGALMAGNSLIFARPYTDEQETYLGNNKWKIELNLSDVESVEEFTKETTPLALKRKQFDYVGQRVQLAYFDRDAETGALLERHGTGLRLSGVDICTVAGVHIYSGSFGLDGLNKKITYQSCSIKPENTKTGLSCDVTGIWGIPPKGYLKIDDCEFWGFGDDEINLFPRMTAAYDIDFENGCLYTHNSYGAGANWEQSVEPGDIIRAYDPQTQEYHGSFRVIRAYYAEGSKRIDFKLLDGTIAHRDNLDNMSLHTEITITNCRFYYGRVRGILYQTGNVTVDHCYFNSCGLVFACDFDEWYEGTPGEKYIVRNCTFENIGTEFYGNVTAKSGGSAIRVECYPPNGVSQDQLARGIFKDVLIENNTFRDICQEAIYASNVDGLVIKNNTMINCGWGTTNMGYRFRPIYRNGALSYLPNGMLEGVYQNTFMIYDYQHYHIYLEYSDNVTVSGNKYDNILTNTRQDSDGNSNDMFFMKASETCSNVDVFDNQYTGTSD